MNNQIAFLTSGNLYSTVAAGLISLSANKKRSKIVNPELQNLTPIFVDHGQPDVNERWLAATKQSIAYGLQFPRLINTNSTPLNETTLISFLLNQCLMQNYTEIFINIPTYVTPYPEYTASFLKKFSKQNNCIVKSPLHIFHSEHTLLEFIESSSLNSKTLAYNPKGN